MPHILAAVATAPYASLEFREFTLAEPEADEVLVRTVASGICHTDILLRDGVFGPALPVIPGHEGAGVVEAVGPGVRGLWVGDHVVTSQGACGRCVECRGAHPMNCRDYDRHNLTGLRPNGKPSILDASVAGSFGGQSSFATHMLVTEANATRMPDDLPLHLGAALGCGMATGAGTVINVLDPAPGASIAVFGAGAVGMAAIMAARMRRCGVIVAVDLNPDRLALARELGATHALDGRDPDVVKRIQAITGGGADCAIDAVGKASVVTSAVASIRPGGHCVLLGLEALGQDIPLPLSLLVFNRKIQGAILGDQVPQVLLPQLHALHAAGDFPYDRLVRTYPFERINDAIADAEAGQVIKPVVTF